MKRLDRYLAWELFKGFGISSLVTILVLLALQVLRLSDLIVRYGLEMRFIFAMMLHLATSFTPLVMPIAFLFSQLLAFGRMATDREFIAMQAMGRSPKRLLLPCVVLGFGVTLLTLWCSFDLAPAGNRGFEAKIDEAWKTKITSVLRSGTFSEGFLDMVIFVDSVDPGTQDLERVFIHDEANFREPISISARRGRWEQNSSTGVGMLRLFDGMMLSQEIDKNIVRRVRFDEYRVNADISRQAGQSRNSPPSWGLKDLLKNRVALRSTPERDPRNVWVELARRIAVSVACLLFVPLCFSLSLDTDRTVRSRAILSALAILIGYWTIYFALVTWLLKTPMPIFRKSETLNWLVVWIPNFIVIVLGSWLFRVRSRLHA